MYVQGVEKDQTIFDKCAGNPSTCALQGGVVEVERGKGKGAESSTPAPKVRG
jgi:hypothetical protein